jgi:hypothetical protein
VYADVPDLIAGVFVAEASEIGGRVVAGDTVIREKSQR